ncbi:hypothetical protein [Comamonas sp.]|uniref:hypothetical protein n=1 Tax=Comamonas sp. TaxID=34028 RepID=UPI002648AA0F|nr:hypothetical protein [Comamonas sp.]MDN5536797.1 hypothetical protein [Comamonas sp.]
MAVQAQGRIRFIDDALWMREHLDSLFGGAIDHADGWKLLLDLPACVADDEGGVNEFR